MTAAFKTIVCWLARGFGWLIGIYGILLVVIAVAFVVRPSNYFARISPAVPIFVGLGFAMLGWSIDRTAARVLKRPKKQPRGFEVILPSRPNS